MLARSTYSRNFRWPVGRRAFEELVQRSTDVEFSGVIVQLTSLDDIIDSKSHAARPKDRDALAELHDLRSRQQAE